MILWLILFKERQRFLAAAPCLPASEDRRGCPNKELNESEEKKPEDAPASWVGACRAKAGM